MNALVVLALNGERAPPVSSVALLFRAYG